MIGRREHLSMRDPRPVFRFAPSPNGELHLGHALSALTCHEQSRKEGGRFLLRIEDIDRGRARDAFVASIFEDLAWLGIVWEQPVVFQSQRTQAYREAAERLDAMGLLYPCFATRSEIDAAAHGALDPDGVPLYPGLWKGRSGAEVEQQRAWGTPYALRIDIAAACRVAREKLAGAALEFKETGKDPAGRMIVASPERWGDAVIVRKDVPTSYHLAVVVDDAWQGVTHVTRGLDLLAATDLHRLLQVLLDLPAPIYHHHRLIVDRSGRKLSKSARDTSLRGLRERGASPAAVRRLAGLA
jgi:glutamyl-Q tRNA(Asp) synthetase